MQTAKITSKGQITLPLNIRKTLNLNDGDRVGFVEKDGRYELVNSNEIAFAKLQEAMEGEAERLGINSLEDVVKIIKEYRKENK